MKYKLEESQYLHIVGRRIRYFREKKGWSQELLSFKSNLHRTYIGGVERGERNISLLNLRKISETLEVSLSDFFDFENEELEKREKREDDQH